MSHFLFEVESRTVFNSWDTAPAGSRKIALLLRSAYPRACVSARLYANEIFRMRDKFKSGLPHLPVFHSPSLPALPCVIGSSWIEKCHSRFSAATELRAAEGGTTKTAEAEGQDPRAPSLDVAQKKAELMRLILGTRYCVYSTAAPRGGVRALRTTDRRGFCVVHLFCCWQLAVSRFG